MAAAPDRSPLTPLVDAVEGAAPLDGPASVVGRTVRGAVGPGPLKDLLTGAWLGHALHPLLTDLVIGSFVSATLLDLLGPGDDGRAANRLTAIGIAAYGPTALTGFTDWADAELADPPVRRTGLVHASTNATALTLYGAALTARRAGARGKARALSAAGASVLGLAGYLGAHLTYARAVRVKDSDSG